MPELSTALPEQALTSTPPQQQQAPVPPAGSPPVTPAPPNPAEPTAEQITQWRTQAEQATQLQQQLQQATESARFHQSNASKFQNALAQVSGGNAPQQPPADPLAADKQWFQKHGYQGSDAELLAEYMQHKIAPLQQELQQSRAAVTNGFQVDQVMQGLYSRHTPLFANPAVYDYTRQAALSYIMQPGAQLDPEMLLDVAASAHYRLGQQPPPQSQGQHQPPPPPQAQPYQGGTLGFRPGYQPQPPAPPQVRTLSPEAQQYERELQSRFPVKK